jgi:microcystin-dependent protein
VSHPFIGEIRMFSGEFAPTGWAYCDGGELLIADYEALFNLIGTTYGGDGQTTFCVPDLRGRLPVHQGNGFSLGQPGGVESVTLSSEQMPAHAHTFQASKDEARTASPPTNVLGETPRASLYVQDQAGVALAPLSLQPAGGNQPHDNVQPYLGVSFIISLFGIFPSQS